MLPEFPILRSLSIAISAVLALVMFLSGTQAAWAGPLDFSSDDTVTITADRAWEAEEPNVIHFSGNFELHAPDWSTSGDTAVVYGNLDDPDRVIVEGSPATVSFLRDSEDDTDPGERVDGEASLVEYFRSTDKLIMKGSSRLVREDSNLTSEIIEYNVETDRYSAGGEGRVNIEYTANDD